VREGTVPSRLYYSFSLHTNLDLVFTEVVRVVSHCYHKRVLGVKQTWST